MLFISFAITPLSASTSTGRCSVTLSLYEEHVATLAVFHLVLGLHCSLGMDLTFPITMDGRTSQSLQRTMGLAQVGINMLHASYS